MKCPNCGTENRSTARFCEQCGNHLPAETKSDKDETLPPALRVKPQAKPIIRPVRVCPQCGTHNAPELRFCEQCAAPLIPAGVTAPPPPRPSRWQPWVLPVGVAGLIVIAALLVVGGLLFFSRAASSERDKAVQVADQIVEEFYPEYAEARQTVSDWESVDGNTSIKVTYWFEADEESGRSFPQALNVYLDPETETIRIEEMN